MVARSMFTQGSRLVIIRQAVSAATASASASRPQAALDARPQAAQGAELGDA